VGVEKQTNRDRADSIRSLICHYAKVRKFDEIPADNVPVFIQGIFADIMHYCIQNGLGNLDKMLCEARHKFIREVDEEIDQLYPAE
jgi:hypothetical protein